MPRTVVSGVEPDRGTGSAGDGLFLLVLVGRAYRALLLTLVTVALVPAVCSWSSFLVRTGSMEPSIAPGDVVIGQPFGAGEKVPVGRVMVFRAPPGSGVGSKLRVHRVVTSLGHERFTTAGDANPTPDAAPVPRANFRARAIIQVPYVGLPLVWLENRQLGLLLVWFVLTVILLQLSFRRIEGDPPPGSTPRHGAARRLVTVLRLPGRGPRCPVVATRAVLVLGIVGLVMTSTGTASAAFSARTASGSNTWRAATNLSQRYTTAVLTDAPYAFHRFDESSGSLAYDSSGGNRTGSFAAVAEYRQSGALPNNTGYAVRLADNGGRMVAGGTGLYDPTTFSVELWFKTTSNTGGKLIGFENGQAAVSTAFDREAFLRTDGRVVYLGGASSSKLLVSPAALNNGAWHHLVITSVPTSAANESTAMYVDGILVASGQTAKAAVAYTGWWRVGYGRVPTGLGYPATGNLTGSVDDVAIYTTALSASRVAAHYAAR